MPPLGQASTPGAAPVLIATPRRGEALCFAPMSHVRSALLSGLAALLALPGCTRTILDTAFGLGKMIDGD